MSIAIHCEPGIKWQHPFAMKMATGLRALGFNPTVTSSRAREADVAVLLGTSMWRQIERDGGRYLLVDRASWGDPQFVSLCWNGHGRRGDHRVPQRPKVDRWKMHGVELHPWQPVGRRTIVAGQCESYSPKYPNMSDWYATKQGATHFRPHPAQNVNPTLLPIAETFDDCRLFCTLNSSVAVDAIIRGVQTKVDDEGGMAYPGFTSEDDRLPWLRWLAYTQWHHDEIASGEPIRHLFED